jgi:hypothetical protein
VFKLVLLGCAAGLVLAVVVVGLGIGRLRAVAGSRTVPLPAEKLVPSDATGAVLVRVRPEDAGVAALLKRFAQRLDAHHAQRGWPERLVLAALGFDRRSDMLAQPLPLEAAIVVRYDPTSNRFHSYIATSLSGLTGLAHIVLRHADFLAPSLAKKYTVQEHRGSHLRRPMTGTPSAGNVLRPEDLYVLFGAAASQQPAWVLHRNTLLLSGSPETLTAALDHLDAPPATAGFSLPPNKPEVDVRASLTNRHGEVACLIELLGESSDSPELAAWIKTPQGLTDTGTIKGVSFVADLQADDRMTMRLDVAFDDYARATRVFLAVMQAMIRWRLPEPLALRVRPDFTPGRIGLNIVLSNIGAYAESQVNGPTP